jgi:hypothetical protein
LETGSDSELVKLLKDFILIKQRNRDNDDAELENNTDMEGIECDKDNDIISLQQNLIDQTADPHVTKIRGAPTKRRIKSAVELLGRKNAMREITSQANMQDEEMTSRSQRKCLLCRKPGHYQKRCPNKNKVMEDIMYVCELAFLFTIIRM